MNSYNSEKALLIMFTITDTLNEKTKTRQRETSEFALNKSEIFFVLSTLKISRRQREHGTN